MFQGIDATRCEDEADVGGGAGEFDGGRFAYAGGGAGDDDGFAG